MIRIMFYRKAPVYQKNIFSLRLMLLVFLLTAFDAYSQNLTKVDSLRQKLGQVDDSRRYDVLWGLAYELFDVDNPKALMYAREAHDYALREGDSLKIVMSGRITGQILRRLDKLDEAVQFLTEVFPIAKRRNFEREIRFILNALALTYTYRAEYDKALEFHFQSLVIREKEGDKKEISTSLNNIGLVYFKLSNFDLALNYYLQALRAKEEVNDTYDLDRLLINIGLAYNNLRDDQNAQKYFTKAFEICGTSCSNRIIIEGEYGLGSSFFHQQNYVVAEKHFKKSLELSIKEENQRFQLENLVSLTEIYLFLNDLRTAGAYRKQVAELADKIQYIELLLRVFQLNADYFIKSKDFEQANYFQRKYSALKDSTLNAEVIKNLTRVQTQYAERENLAIIAAKDQVLALKEEVISQARILNWLLIAVIVLTTTLGIVIYRNYQSIKSVNADLASAKKIIEDHNLVLDREVKEKTKELLDTNESLVKVNDELDNFIYKTSHDIRGPLASLKGMVNLAIMDVKDDKALGYLSKLDLTAEKLNMILTRLLIVNRINHTELKPELIHFEPIIQEILTLEMKKGVPAKIKIEYDVAPDLQLMSDKEMVRLILENLIDNAVKFYNESERVESFVRISVQSVDGKVTARVMDNGVGIAQMNREKIFQMFVRASERSDTGGIGLYLAKIATEKLGGDINLVSTDEKYTEFIVQFPHALQTILEKRKEERRRHEEEPAEPKVKQNITQSI